ncbi:MAG TPA: hypothetical protein VEK57_10330 [Thermoanaerobaculia bacterium]|nr:hypothetical protein [Thermoanaerobaculia bacterium]
MFDVLANATTATTAGAISRALTELFKAPKNGSRTLRQIRAELAHGKLESPEHKAAAALALRILEEVAASRHKDLNALTEKDVREVARTLSRILEEKATAEPLYDKSAGTAILDDLRREYASFA